MKICKQVHVHIALHIFSEYALWLENCSCFLTLECYPGLVAMFYELSFFFSSFLIIFQEEEIKLKPVIAFDCGKKFFSCLLAMSWCNWNVKRLMYSIVIIKYIFLIHSFCMASNVAVSFIKILLDYGVGSYLCLTRHCLTLFRVGCVIYIYFFLFCHSDIFKVIYVEQNAISIRFLKSNFFFLSIPSSPYV